MDADAEQVLKQVKVIKGKLEALERSSAAHRSLPGCGPGSSADRSRTSVVTGLGKKLKDMMDYFQAIRTKMSAEYKETVERRYFTITGEKADEETIENLISSGQSEMILQKAIQEQGRGQVLDTVKEMQERCDAITEMEKNLVELHQVFLDMAALVEAQGQQLNDIESNVARADSFVSKGTGELQCCKISGEDEKLSVHSENDTSFIVVLSIGSVRDVMEIIALNLRQAIYFHHSTCRTKLLVDTSHYWSCHRRVKLPSPPHPSIKTRLPKLSSSTITRRNKNCNKRSTSSDVLRLIDSLGFTATPDIYASLIEECTFEGDSVRANELYAHMERNKRMMNFVKQPFGLPLLNRMLVMCFSCSCMDAAHQLFDKIPQRDSISWAIMIAGFFHYASYDQALDLFVEMHRLHSPIRQCNAMMRVIVACVLKACVYTSNMSMGKLVHGWLIKSNYARDSFASTALINFYGKFGYIQESNSVFFDQIQMHSCHDPGLWTVAIIGNCHEEHFDEVLCMFKKMCRAGIRKDQFVFSSVIKACGRVNDDGWCGQQVHANAIKVGVDSHVFVECSLVDMYGKFGLVGDAKKVFDLISCEKRNRACWNAMVKSCIENDLCVEAIKILYQMKAAGFQHQESLLNQVRIACGSSNQFEERNNKVTCK
ncbi:hypothetical protein Nepgr_000457 [Nepenthes gracilis]|uniref:t-SNARE coiled-coil homology domain-containing protein n=1 Tax=Nepenthes gracilis TaxID=150966 RepID=A0AAD3P3J6_NEPGR|nr:hypothetical protein Nepgr_000457 [Nepenthes gracilis]